MALCKKLTLCKKFSTYKKWNTIFICLTKICFKQLVKLFISESGFYN